MPILCHMSARFVPELSSLRLSAATRFLYSPFSIFTYNSQHNIISLIVKLFSTTRGIELHKVIYIPRSAMQSNNPRKIYSYVYYITGTGVRFPSSVFFITDYSHVVCRIRRDGEGTGIVYVEALAFLHSIRYRNSLFSSHGLPALYKGTGIVYVAVIVFLHYIRYRNCLL